MSVPAAGNDSAPPGNGLSSVFHRLALGFTARDPDDLERIEIARRQSGWARQSVAGARYHPEIKRLAGFGGGALIGGALLYSVPYDVLWAVHRHYLPAAMERSIAIPTVIFHTLGAVALAGALTNVFIFVPAVYRIGKALHIGELRQFEMAEQRAIRMRLEESRKRADQERSKAPPVVPQNALPDSLTASYSEKVVAPLASVFSWPPSRSIIEARAAGSGDPEAERHFADEIELAGIVSYGDLEEQPESEDKSPEARAQRLAEQVAQAPSAYLNRLLKQRGISQLALKDVLTRGERFYDPSAAAFNYLLRDYYPAGHLLAAIRQDRPESATVMILRTLFILESMSPIPWSSPTTN